MKVVFSDLAQRDLRKIAFFIARDNRARTLSFVRELRTRAKELGKIPLAFPLASHFESQGVRRRV